MYRRLHTIICLVKKYDINIQVNMYSISHLYIVYILEREADDFTRFPFSPMYSVTILICLFTMYMTI